MFYRIGVVVLHLPPLRERREDIPVLATHFLGCIRQQAPDAPASISDDCLRLLCRHDWPGNVRELQNVIYSMAIEATAPELTAAHLPKDFSEMSERRRRPIADPSRLADADGRVDLPKTVERLERETIEWALTVSGRNHSKAAELLRIPRTTLNEKLKKLYK